MKTANNIQKVVKTSGRLDSWQHSRPEKGSRPQTEKTEGANLHRVTRPATPAINQDQQPGTAKTVKRLNGDNSMNDYCPAGSMKSEIKKREKKKNEKGRKKDWKKFKLML